MFHIMLKDNGKSTGFAVGMTNYTHAYDACGNLLTENTNRHHQWGWNDSLRHFMNRVGSSPPTIWAHYFYDAFGQRVKKVVGKPGRIREVTIYIDGVFEHSYVSVNNVIDSNKHYNTLHVMDGRSRIATERVGTDTDDSTPTVKYNVEDHLGTSTVVLTNTGTLVNREEYYPFGETCFGAFAKKRYRYVGKEKDNESGLYYYGARYYAPWTCRFVSVDPLAASYAHLTPYNYAGNKPIGDLDIDGMQGTGESTSEFPLNPTDEAGNTVPIALKEFEVIGTKPPSDGAKTEASATLAVAPTLLAVTVREPLRAVTTNLIDQAFAADLLKAAPVEGPSGAAGNLLLRTFCTVGAILLPTPMGTGDVPLRPIGEPNYDTMDTEHNPRSELAYQDLVPSVAQPATESTSTPLTQYGQSTATATEERFRFYATYTKTAVLPDGSPVTYSGRTADGRRIPQDLLIQKLWLRCEVVILATT
jgi:RHS repeat-associated protein